MRARVECPRFRGHLSAQTRWAQYEATCVEKAEFERLTKLHGRVADGRDVPRHRRGCGPLAPAHRADRPRCTRGGARHWPPVVRSLMSLPGLLVQDDQAAREDAD